MEVGIAMIETERLLRAGTIRVGGPSGEVIEVGSVPKGRFLQALSESGRYGPVSVPDDTACEVAVQEFGRYREDLRRRFSELAAQRTRDQRRQRAIDNALMRKALSWRKETG